MSVQAKEDLDAEKVGEVVERTKSSRQPQRAVAAHKNGSQETDEIELKSPGAVKLVDQAKPNELKQDDPASAKEDPKDPPKKILDLKKVDDIGKKKTQTNKKSLTKAKPENKQTGRAPKKTPSFEKDQQL